MNKIYESQIISSSNQNRHLISLLRTSFSLLCDGTRIGRKEKVFSKMLSSCNLEDKEKLAKILKEELASSSRPTISFEDAKKQLKDFNNNASEYALIKTALVIKDDPYRVFVDALNNYLGNIKKQVACRKNNIQELLLKKPEKEKLELIEHKKTLELLGGIENIDKLNIEQLKNLDEFLLSCVSDGTLSVSYINEFDILFKGEDRDILKECIVFINCKKQMLELTSPNDVRFLLKQMTSALRYITPRVLVSKQTGNYSINQILERIGAYDFVSEYQKNYAKLDKELCTDIKFKPELVIKEINRETMDFIIQNNALLDSKQISFATKNMDAEEKNELAAKVNAYGNLNEVAELTNRIKEIKNDFKKRTLTNKD